MANCLIPAPVLEALKRVNATMTIFKAKCLEFDAILSLNSGDKAVEDARSAVMAAEEAVLDAKIALYRETNKLNA